VVEERIVILPPVRILLVLTAVVFAGTTAALAFREGPLPNMTGGFGDQTCRLCHFDGPLNAPGGRVALSAPATFVAGRTYPVTVTLTRKAIERGGFEIGARFASGAARGHQAGTWIVPAGGRVQSVKGQQDPSLIFLQHTTAGTTTKTPGRISWTLQWTAPAAPDAVQFNVATNAANDDASPLGDHIYTAVRVSRPAPK
jgi:hypothetical protein